MNDDECKCGHTRDDHHEGEPLEEPFECTQTEYCLHNCPCGLFETPTHAARGQS